MGKTGDEEGKRGVWQTEQNIGNKMRDRAGKRWMEAEGGTRKGKEREETARDIESGTRNDRRK
jgi:hypothetical protein